MSASDPTANRPSNLVRGLKESGFKSAARVCCQETGAEIVKVRGCSAPGEWWLPEAARKEQSFHGFESLKKKKKLNGGLGFSLHEYGIFQSSARLITIRTLGLAHTADIDSVLASAFTFVHIFGSIDVSSEVLVVLVD